MLHTRRRFLLTLGAAAMSHGVHGRQPSGSALPSIDAARLRRYIEELSVFGRPAGGDFASGVNRVAYSAADIAGRRYAMDLMVRAGLAPRIDTAGNIFARRAGRDDTLPPLLFGSHIDSVPSGGNFDGDLGSLAALEILQTFAERRIVTRHPLEMVIWANEEGVAYNNGLCGSRAAAGELRDGELDHVWNGVIKRDAIRAIGGHPDRIDEAVRERGSFHSYLELHIEQGGTLERSSTAIGVVEGIVAIDRYEATIRGFANHAGTTPMPDRQDALIAASQLVLAVREVVTRERGRQVGTVGQLAVAPNAPNVIPGEVKHTIELRDLSAEKIARLAAEIRARAAEIGRATRTEITIAPASHHGSALADTVLQEAIGKAADLLGLSHLRLPSGAGHDAQMMARLGPMGMIFVPSVGGISHSPRELTTWEDCANGARVLMATLLAMDGNAVRS
jgi:beta-ureidopropionase / N-carbamoyl-L-amino-acid hydrolase